MISFYRPFALIAIALAILDTSMTTSLGQTSVRPSRRAVPSRAQQGQRKPASLTDASSSVVRNPPAKIVNVGKKSYVYAERYTPRGRLLSTIYVGENFREVKVDEFGTGTASKWDITKDGTTMRASRPYRGHFTKIELEKRRKKDRVFLEFSYLPRIKRYHLDRTFAQPYSVLNSDSVVFGDTCSLSNVQNLDTFRRIVDQLNANDTSGDALACRLQAEAPLLFDPSCMNAGAPMKDSIPDITKALADLLESGPVKDTTRTSKSGYVSASSGTYLSCIEQHGLAEHSALIQGELDDILQSAHDQVDVALAQHVITQEEHDLILNPQAPNCEMDAALMLKIRKRIKNTGNGGKPLFTCEKPPGTSESDKGTYRGNFFSTRHSNQIFLDLPKEAMPGALRPPGAPATPAFTAESAYASTLLHEFIHSSGIDDENLTTNAETCCAGVDADLKRTACRSVENRLVGSATSYEAESRFGNVINSGNFAVSESTEIEFMNKKLNSGEDAKELMARYQQYVARKIEADSDEHARIKDKDGTLCSQTQPDDYCLQKQIEFSQSHLISYTDEFLKERCPIVLSGQNRANTTFCESSALKKKLEGYVIYQATPAPVTGSTAALQPGDSASLAAAGPPPKSDPYADMYAVQEGISSTTADSASDGAVALTGDGQTNGISSSVPMKDKVAMRPGDGQTAGRAGDIAAGAAPGQAGVASSSRPDGLDGGTPSTAVVDNAAKVVGQLLPDANAADEIVITARRPASVKPDKTKSVGSSDSGGTLAIPWVATAAPPAVSRSADSASRKIDSPSTETSFTTPGNGPGVFAGTAPTARSGPTDLGAEKSANNVASPTRDPRATNGVPVLGTASEGGAAGSSGTTAAAPNSPGATGPDQSRERSGAPTGEMPALSPTSGVPTLQTAQQLENWLALDYTRIQDRLETTKMRIQLIQLRTEVVGPDGMAVGCVPHRSSTKDCTPLRIYNYCRPQSRLLPSTRACR